MWEEWTDKATGEVLESCTLLTTDANADVRPVHHRMPVIVPPEAFDLWLDHRAVDAEEAASLIRPAPADLLET